MRGLWVLKGLSQLAVPVVLLVLWEIGARAGLIKPLFFPPPSAIWHRFLSMWTSDDLPSQFETTLTRLILGVGIGGTIGTAFGIAMGRIVSVDRGFDSLISLTHPLPKIALLPLFLVFFGYGEPTRVILVGLSAFFPMVIAARTAVWGLDPLMVKVCQNYGVTGFLALRRMVLPACLPVLLAGLQLAFNTALIVTISVEMLAANDGLGAVLWLGWQTMRLADIYVVLGLIGGCGFGFSILISWLQKSNIQEQS